MMRDWRLRKKIIGVAGCLLLINGIGGIIISRQVARQIRTYLPAGTTIGHVRWSFPFSIVLDRLSVPDSSGKNPFLLRVDRAVLEIPWWGMLARPLPAKVTLTQPHLKIGSDNINLLIGGMEVDPNDWILRPFKGMDRSSLFRRVPFIPYGLNVNNARVEVIEEEIRKGHPVFIADHVNLSLELTAILAEPAIRLISHGDFVTESGEKIGFQEVDFRCHPRKKAMEGSIRLRQERLGDFRNLYQYAPRPIFIEGGIADFSIQFALTNGKHLKMTAHTLVQNLDLEGKVGEVSWADIMHAVEDRNRIYEWTVPAEGEMDDPAFNPHDHVLSEVEWKMKEKAASRGLKIPGQMFFYADSKSA